MSAMTFKGIWLLQAFFSVMIQVGSSYKEGVFNLTKLSMSLDTPFEPGVISGALPYLRDDLLVHHTADKHR